MSAISIVELKKLAPTVGASETNLEIAKFSSDFESSLNFRLDMLVSGVAVTTGITAKLQCQIPNGDFQDLASANSSVSITADGSFSIKLNVQNTTDQGDLPLCKSCRVVITTGAGDAVTFDRIIVQQR